MDKVNGTPRAHRPVGFANRAYESPLVGNRRFGTPTASSSRKPFNGNSLSASTMSQKNFNDVRNIFQTSSLGTSTGPRFDPSIPTTTRRKIFAPAATPDSKKIFRDSTTKATPRRTMAGTSSSELFKMVIPSPPRELTGAALTKEVPKDLDQHGSVFADQYLAHLCPKEFDDLQRRQFFCILDLRRLKHAADEIFAKKDWKLNIMNFAKEFEKSRSLIMLRYGLYEFKNVRPSAEVLRKWRAAHGLHDDDDAASRPQPAKASNKRKADDDLDHGVSATIESTGNKRRAMDKGADSEQADALFTNKRKASLSGDSQQVSKQQKTTPSLTKSVFEKIASKPGTFAAPSITSATPKPAAAKPSLLAAPSGDSNLARSVLDKSVSGTASGNIFGYLSDASSAKNSGVDADAESETESEADEDTQEAGSGTTIAKSQAPSAAINSFGSKTSSISGFATGASSTTSEARETTPGRSLFDRVTKGSDGQPLRVTDDEEPEKEPTPEAAPAPQAALSAAKDLPANKTWTPNSPLKFAPQPPQGASLFGNAATPSSSLFAAKPSQPTSSIFGAPKPAKAEDKAQDVSDVDKSGGESDKENVSQPATKALAAPFDLSKSTTGAQPSPTSVFKSAPSELSKPTTTPEVKAPAKADEAQKSTEAGPSSASSIFGAKSQGATNMFASQAQTSTTAASPFQSSTLFGAKPAEPTPTAEAPKPSGLFGAPSKAPEPAAAETPKPLFGATSTAATEAPKTSSLFGNSAKPAPSSLFGASSGASNLFGSSQGQPTGTPTFSFGASTTTPAAPIGSETPKPKIDKATSGNALFGSPMKQDGPSPGKRGFGDAMQEDNPSPVKKPFGANAAPSLFGASQGPAGSTNGNGTPLFNFGGTPAASNASAPSLFGANSTPAAGGMNFNFTPGGQTSSGSTGFQFGADKPAAPPSGGMFNFGGSTPNQPPASGGFVFGGASNTIAAPAQATPSGNQGGANPFAFSGTPAASTPSGRPIKKPNFAATKARARMGGSPAPQAPMFGGNQANPPAPLSAPTFNFTAASPQPQQNLFGGNANGSSAPLFSGLQAPPAGASTNGTSMFSFGTH